MNELLLRRRVLMMAQKKSRLPSAYQEVEYLESSGTQYIEPGLFATNPWRAVIGFTFLSLDGVQVLTGCYWGDINNRGRNILRKENSNNKLSIANNTYSTTLYTVPVITNTLYEIDAKFWTRSEILIVNGQLFQKNSAYMSAGGHIALLALYNYDSNSTQNQCIGKITHAEYYNQNDDMVRQFVMCYRKSDSKPGMYDLINDVFYTNAGSGEFIVGPDVN